MTELEMLSKGHWYFINSDAKTLGPSPHDLWFESGMAFTGGDMVPYGQQLAVLRPGDALLLWANGLGVVAVGRVQAPWDGKAYRQHRICYRPPCDDDEYRVRVDWLIDLRRNPVVQKDFGYNPRQSMQRIGEDRKAKTVELVRRAAADAAATAPRAAAVEPGEEDDPTYVEGAVRVHISTRYERDQEARNACIEHYGASCVVCAFDFGKVYGELGEGFIHVHHLLPISAVGGSHEVDPVVDLRPVCPNCHAMLHKRTQPLTIEELQDALQRSGVQ